MTESLGPKKDLRPKSLTFQPEKPNVEAEIGSPAGLNEPNSVQESTRMRSAPKLHQIVDKETFEGIREEFNFEKVGDIEAAAEEELPPLRDIDRVMGMKEPIANQDLRTRVSRAAWRELERKAAELDQMGGVIVMDFADDEGKIVGNVYRHTTKAEVYRMKSSE